MSKYNEKLGTSIEEILKANRINSLDIFSETIEPQYLVIPVEKIILNDLLLSRYISDEELSKAMNNIKEFNLITPIVVRKREDQAYDLITGVKRLTAVKALNHKVIPAIVLSIKEEEAIDIMVSNKIDSEVINPIEKASTYLYMAKSLKLNQTQIAKKVNRSRPYITNHLRLLSLPKEIKNYLMEGKLSFGQARPLINLPLDEQINLARRIINENLSAREIENIASLSLKGEISTINLEELSKKAANLYNCDVIIKKNAVILKGKSAEDLEKILNTLVK
jgi:ParB family chromosome partitioning protein